MSEKPISGRIVGVMNGIARKGLTLEQACERYNVPIQLARDFMALSPAEKRGYMLGFADAEELERQGRLRA